MLIEILTLMWSNREVKRLGLDNNGRGDRDMFVPFEGENPLDRGPDHNTQAGDQENNYYPDDFDDFGDPGAGGDTGGW